MKINRRNFLSNTAFLGLSSVIPYKAIAAKNQTINFNSNELRIGVITWSYRSLPSNLYSVIGYCLDSELNAMALKNNPELIKHYELIKNKNIKDRKYQFKENKKLIVSNQSHGSVVPN